MFAKHINIKTVLIIVFLISCFFIRKFIEKNRELKKQEEHALELEIIRVNDSIQEAEEMKSEYEFKKDYEEFLRGKKKCEGSFINDKREGKWMCFFPTGKIESEGVYKDDAKEGEWIVYFDSGDNYSWKENRSFSIHEKQNYKKGVKNGAYTLYHHNKRIYISAYYKNDKIDSVYNEYYANGKINSLGMYKEGKKIGEWNYFSETGAIIKTEKFN